MGMWVVIGHSGLVAWLSGLMVEPAKSANGYVQHYDTVKAQGLQRGLRAAAAAVCQHACGNVADRSTSERCLFLPSVAGSQCVVMIPQREL